MKSLRPKLVIRVAYKKPEGYWRAFCYPYDVTVERKTAKEAMADLDESVALYEEGLKKYDYPSHLSIKPLTDKEDQKVFESVKKEIAKDVERRIRSDINSYQISPFQKITTGRDQVTACYTSHPAFA